MAKGVRLLQLVPKKVDANIRLEGPPDAPGRVECHSDPLPRDYDNIHAVLSASPEQLLEPE